MIISIAMDSQQKAIVILLNTLVCYRKLLRRYLDLKTVKGCLVLVISRLLKVLKESSKLQQLPQSHNVPTPNPQSSGLILTQVLKIFSFKQYFFQIQLFTHHDLFRACTVNSKLVSR